MVSPSPVKISHKKDGCQKWPHRFHVSCPPPPHPAAGSATENVGHCKEILVVIQDNTGFPLVLKNLENDKGIFQSGKSQEKSRNSGNFREMLFVIFSDI